MSSLFGDTKEGRQALKAFYKPTWEKFKILREIIVKSIKEEKEKNEKR